MSIDDQPKRVGVFLDGQNVTIGARHAFGHANMHPLLVARSLCEPGELLVEVRYATGIPAKDVDPERNQIERRRHDLMLATDVVVLERPLRYRWEWAIRDRSLGDPRDSKDQVRQARVTSRNRGQEKGIDVWIALDALAMCVRADLDKVIIASADSDLDLVPDYVHLVGAGDTEVVQARVMADGREVQQRPPWDAVVAIDRAVFDRCRDDFDYRDRLDADAVAAFVASIGAERDGIRD